MAPSISSCNTIIKSSPSLLAQNHTFRMPDDHETPTTCRPLFFYPELRKVRVIFAFYWLRESIVKYVQGSWEIRHAVTPSSGERAFGFKPYERKAWLSRFTEPTPKETDLDGIIARQRKQVDIHQPFSGNSHERLCSKKPVEPFLHRVPMKCQQRR